MVYSPTSSSCGNQAMSRNCSSPSFSFGGGRSRNEKVILKPLSPGPVYCPMPSTKRLGDAPQAKFGTAQQRPRLISASGPLAVQEDSYLTPGPGSYNLRSSLQQQPLSRSRSSGAYSFGATSATDITKSATQAGPAMRSVRRQTVSSERRTIMTPGSPGPGGCAFPTSPGLHSGSPSPLAYNLPSSLNRQVKSRSSSKPAYTFSSTKRDSPCIPHLRGL